MRLYTYTAEVYLEPKERGGLSRKILVTEILSHKAATDLQAEAAALITQDGDFGVLIIHDGFICEAYSFRRADGETQVRIEAGDPNPLHY